MRRWHLGLGLGRPSWSPSVPHHLTDRDAQQQHARQRHPEQRWVAYIERVDNVAHVRREAYGKRQRRKIGRTLRPVQL